MTPRNDRLLELYNELVRMSLDVYLIKSVEKLVDFRDKYILWNEETKKYIKKSKINSNYIGLFLTGYQPMRNLIENGGIGLKWNDNRTQNVYSDIKEDINKKLELFAKMPEEKKQLEKRDGGFYFNGDKIEMDETTQYAELLNCLYLKSDNDGFTPYKTIMSKLDCTKTDIHNTLKSLFRFAKIKNKRLSDSLNLSSLIEIKRGKGLILKRNS